MIKPKILGFSALLMTMLAFTACVPDLVVIFDPSAPTSFRDTIDLKGEVLPDCAGKAYTYTNGSLRVEGEYKVSKKYISYKIEVKGHKLELVDASGNTFKANESLKFELKQGDVKDGEDFYIAKLKVKFKLYAPKVKDPVTVYYYIKVAIPVAPTKTIEPGIIKEKGSLENIECIGFVPVG